MTRGAKKTLVKQVREEAESLGFVYRASDENAGWITFTYPGTNSHVVLIDIASTGNIRQKLGEELVRCGRIQIRQKLAHELSPLNYD